MNDHKKFLFNQYIDFHNTYTEKYGPDTVVLLQNGSHFNLFAIINDTLNLGPDIYHIGNNILNITVTKQNKKIPEISYNNHLLAGFPVNSIQKYENILLSHNYTVIIVEHITPPPNPERGVTRIVSPGTTMNDYHKKDSNYLMSIYIEKYEYVNKDTFNVGLGVIDLSTGKNKLHPIISKLEDINYWSDEISRYIHFYNPSEIVFHTKNLSLSVEQIIQRWDISHNSIQLNHYKENPYHTLSYQNTFLKNIFTIKSQMTPIETFDLETYPELIISYIYLLQYIHDHRSDILSNIEHPDIILDDKCLCLTSNSIRQLNVIHNYSYFKGKNESLLSVCNLCVTPMGRRLCKERLLYPSIDGEVIQKRYNYIEYFRKDNFYEVIHKDLRKVSDLEKSLRKMGVLMYQPQELFSDSLSFEYIEKIIKHFDGFEYPNYDHIIHKFQEFYKEINDTFEFQNFSTTQLERSLFKSGIYDEMDIYDKLMEDYNEIFTLVTKRLSKLLDNSENSIKYDYDERNGWHIYCTNKRCLTFKERLTNLHGNMIHVKNNELKLVQSFSPDEFTFKSKDKSSKIIECEYSKDISQKLQKIQYKIIDLNKELWNQTIEKLYHKYQESLKELYVYLANIDVYCSGAKLSIQNGYCKPELQTNEKSFCDCKDIRHPIVEKIHINTEYITNDIQLGINNHDGMLLFGTNACGKSTLMKAIGLNIILAQAGFYVAASSFIYKPYTQIFTRILNNDNIFRSQSSFAVEIQELKSILNRADHNSLVLGDELCSGTESISALSIITTGLHTLCSRKSTFIFTSHLHQLITLEEIKNLDNLDIFHLKINYDREKNILIYDRKLSNGSGPSIYGLQVCEAMGLSNDFIGFAKKIQNRLEKESICSTKQSVYNPNIFMQCCEICGSKEKLETHHIKDQQFADKHKMIGNHHKNIKHNLVPLCSKCHLQVTNHEIVVKGWKETSEGNELEWYQVEKIDKTRKSFSNKDIDKILSLKNETYPKLSQINFVKTLELHHNIKLSVSTWRKILKGVY